MKLLYKPDEKSRGITDEQLSAVFENYPLAKTVLDLIKKFKALLKKRKPNLFIRWMDKVESLGTPKLETFVDGLKLDIGVVKNAFIFDASNGLAEGTINKLKIIKKVMYCRCNFDLQRSKCLILGYLT